MMTGGQILIKALHHYDVRHIFCVAGESYLAALDALYDYPDIKVVTCRQEGGAAFMAEAHGKLTGRPGICFVTRGPGACNAAIGVHTAKQDSTPMVLFVGQVARQDLGREAFQEIDYRQMFSPPIAKAVFQIERAQDVAQTVKKAFELALSGRPGPVVVALPEDMLRETCEEPEALPITVSSCVIKEEDMANLARILSKASRPVCLVGGSLWDDKTSAAFESWAAAHHLPVVAAFRRQDAFDNTHPCYVGELGTGPNPQLVEKIKTQADCILALGTRLSEITSQSYTLLDIPEPKQKFVHVYPAAEEFGRVYKPTLTIKASPASFVPSLPCLDVSSWISWRQGLRDMYEAWTDLDPSGDFAVDIDAVYQILREVMPQNAIVTTDAGNFSGWAQRYLRYKRPGRLLAPTSGAMGYAVPSAVAASIAHPDRCVVAFMGDGGFMMTGQELATARQTGARPIFLIFNNGIYGTIRMHQERDYPGRAIATDLTNPDFAGLAQSYGIQGFTVHETDDFEPVFKEALAATGPVVIELKTDAEQISHAKRMSDL